MAAESHPVKTPPRMPLRPSTGKGQLVNNQAMSLKFTWGSRTGTAFRSMPPAADFTEEPEKDFPEQLERLRVSGVKRAKIKIGAGPQCDRERVSIARKVLGDDTGIIVDANGNYTCDEALESMRRIADYGIEWYEEPLPPLEFRRICRLTRSCADPDRDRRGALHRMGF